MMPQTLLRYRSLLWAALLAGLWHVLMPFMMVLPVSSGIEMTMCTAGGVKSVRVSPDFPAVPAPEKKGLIRCPLCLAGAHFALTAPASLPDVLLRGLHHVQADLPPHALHLSLQWWSYHPRAPPQF